MSLVLEEEVVQRRVTGPLTVEIRLQFIQQFFEFSEKFYVLAALVGELVAAQIHSLEEIGIVQFLADLFLAFIRKQVILSHRVQLLGETGLWHVGQGFDQVLLRRSKELLELLRLVNVRASYELLEELIKIEASLINELLVLVPHLLLWRQLRHVEALVSGF